MYIESIGKSSFGARKLVLYIEVFCIVSLIMSVLYRRFVVHVQCIPAYLHVSGYQLLHVHTHKVTSLITVLS